ncbi:DUF1761 domain-containing protein [Novosphingobium panipatense]|uniref:DUF1761 domain-containing protein n=1 Tax=Novosphingobium panipatense TaxID=428991 RepID=UPI00361F64AA
MHKSAEPASKAPLQELVTKGERHGGRKLAGRGSGSSSRGVDRGAPHRTAFSGRTPDRSRKAELAGNYATAIIVFLIGATMLGHSFARIGSETLAVKPWLYFMQSGGVALAFVVPAVWITHVHNRVEPLRRVIDCLFWIVSYLGMGIVFWALG